MMNKTQKQRVIAINAAVLAAGMLASFVLPLIVESLIDGRGAFLRALTHIFPLVCAMAFSCSLMGKAIPESAE
ncbi:hypothetical protein [Novipirellula artificiosorum]|uniref:Uncharacterized protein n=1 Tax=Novipirellula artificiosorum TaxID=2528016 RepID=A0A5C6E0Y1_9BACT|nr:hypothetical protein [Novipirellula artificiosorum]TWU42375.1 hypothetical protein Poly41_06720 [Novipirellula artificiosorum]